MHGIKLIICGPGIQSKAHSMQKKHGFLLLQLTKILLQNSLLKRLPQPQLQQHQTHPKQQLHQLQQKVIILNSFTLLFTGIPNDWRITKEAVKLLQDVSEQFLVDMFICAGNVQIESKTETLLSTHVQYVY